MWCGGGGVGVKWGRGVRRGLGAWMTIVIKKIIKLSEVKNGIFMDLPLSSEKNTQNTPEKRTHMITKN